MMIWSSNEFNVFAVGKEILVDFGKAEFADLLPWVEEDVVRIEGFCGCCVVW